MRIRQGLTYANLTATVAVFIALGGGAYAVSKDSVGSKEIENGTVRSRELKDDDVRAADIEEGAVQASEVDDGSLGAGEIDDGSLGAGEIADGSLGAGEIADGSLAGADVADGSLAGADVGDGSLNGADISAGAINGRNVANDSLDADDIKEGDFYFGNLPIAGVLSAQARDIGGDGSILFGPISGRAAADNIEEVAVALPPSFFGTLSVFLPADLGVGQSRKFTVVLQESVAGPEVETEISCTVTASQDRCFDFAGQDSTSAGLASVKIENEGVGLSATDSAYLGLSVKTPLQEGPLGP